MSRVGLILRMTHLPLRLRDTDYLPVLLASAGVSLMISPYTALAVFLNGLPDGPLANYEHSAVVSSVDIHPAGKRAECRQ